MPATLMQGLTGKKPKDRNGLKAVWVYLLAALFLISNGPDDVQAQNTTPRIDPEPSAFQTFQFRPEVKIIFNAGYRRLALNFNFDYQNWRAEDGNHKVYLVDGTAAATRLNEVNRSCYSLGLGLELRF